MADKKISQLTGASTPLAGSEVLPIVQSGSTVKVSAADVTAGRAVSALTYTSTATTGTAPLIVASTTEVANLRAANATSSDAANAVKSNATTGVLQVTGPAAASTRTMTVPDANFTVARTDAAQTFTGAQTVQAAATQDSVALAGRAGGTSSYISTITPTTLTGSRTVTLPDANTTIPVASQVLTFNGPSAARTITLPDANFSAARIDAAQSFSGTQTFVNTTVYEADAFGKRCMTGSNAGNPYTITITGVPGIGSGDYRDFTRITMIGVFSVASGHIVRGWAYYSSDYDGSARLIQTVGSVTIGGSITFGSSGNNPTATITNTSGNSADYEVWFRVFM